MATLPTGASEYDPGAVFDEAFAAPGVARAHYAPLLSALAECDLEGLRAAVGRRMADEGVTFRSASGDAPFLVDPLPRLVTADEWARLETGLAQRLRALDAFVADVYGPRSIVGMGVVPERVVAGAAFLEPELVGCSPAAGAWIGIAGLDLVRDDAGDFVVLEDNLRTPSGMAYALHARGAVEALLPHATEARDIVGELRRLLRGVVEAARRGHDGVAVLLSDGDANSAWFEHRELAELAGLELVLPGEVRRRGERLELRDGRGVDVVYRRTDTDRLFDPHGRPTEIGDLLLAPWRAGSLGLVNAFGTGVADDKLVYPYVEEMVRFYLDEEPLVRSVRTYDLAARGAREEALDRLDELVVKPRDGHGGHGVLIGPAASPAELRDAAAAVRADPADWVAQEVVHFSTHPTVVDGALAPRHVDLRPFVFFDGSTAHALPGGLTRVAFGAGELVVNSSRDGGGKDTWVLP